jgi:transposase
MPKEKLSMRTIQEVLRLKWDCQQSNRQIAESCSIARSTVSDYLIRAKAAGISWPLPSDLDEEKLNALLFPHPRGCSREPQLQPEWEKVHAELRSKGMTLMQLWSEYKADHPDGYQYSQYCHQYRQWKQHVEPCLRQEYKAGEKLFVDYCGQTVPVVDRSSGEIRQAQIFVAVWGATNYTYAEATWTQQLPDWIGSHVRALDWFGGCPEVLIPDNLKSGVSKACRYEPDLNPTYQSMAEHYGIAVLPARVRKPRDKAKVEKGVQTVEQWILAALRNHPFFSLYELNQAIREGIQVLNERPFQKLPGCRTSLFDSLERPVLKALPMIRYEYAEWKKARIHVDYHVEVERHYYSVPYTYLRRPVEIRVTARTVEVFYQGLRIASHVRSQQPGGHTTRMEHMPKSHQDYLGWPPKRLQAWAEKIGICTSNVIDQLLERRSHPTQGYRSCLGILRLAKKFGADRLEQACQRAVHIQALSYKSILSILKKRLDQLPLPEPASDAAPLEHDNLRGPQYFQ